MLLQRRIDSYYERTLAEPDVHSPPLQGPVEVETCVIGGGLAGLATALELAQRGRSVAVLEAHTVGWGASGRNGGFLSIDFHRDMQDIAAKVGLADSQEMFNLCRDGHRAVLERIALYNIDCGPVVTGGVACNMASGGEDLPRYIAYMARHYDHHLEHWPRARVAAALATPQYADAYFSRDVHALHPLNFTRGLARAVLSHHGQIFEHTRAQSMARAHGRHIVKTDAGEVQCDEVVLAGGGYLGSRLNWSVGMATVPVATFVMVTEPLGERLSRAIRVPYAVHDLQVATNYYRSLADGRLLWGGRVRMTEPSQVKLQAILAADMASFYPDLAGVRIEIAWSGYMGFHLHRMPFVGRVGDGVWVAGGFGGLGLAQTSMAGRLIAAGIAERDDRWRLFTRYGLPFAGGPLGRMPVQMIYWSELAKARMRALRKADVG